jgi:hypothetical protein
MINSEPLQDLLASFLNEVGVAPGTVARLPIPPYDQAAAGGVVQAAKAAANAVAANDKQALADAEAKVHDEVMKLLTAGTATQAA